MKKNALLPVAGKGMNLRMSVCVAGFRFDDLRMMSWMPIAMDTALVTAPV